MPLQTQGMLLTSMDVDPAQDLDFNRWYDREHLAERVAIPGFVEARRYVADDATPKYLSLYSTQTFDVLDSAAYRAALANQTAWSKANIARFRNMIRAVAHITASRGQGRGAALGLVRIRPPSQRADELRKALVARFEPELYDGVISMHLLESDPGLSKSLTDPTATAGSADWFVLIDGTSPSAVAPLARSHFADAAAAASAEIVAAGTYRLLFDLASADL
jgi:hypothetical protein